MFSEKEVAYLKSQPLLRLGTVSTTLQVDVSPVGFQFDGQFFYIHSSIMEKTLKYKNIAAGNSKVSLVVDDLESLKPYTPRGIKIHGTAEIMEREGEDGLELRLRIKPTKSWSWGILAPGFQEDGSWKTTRVIW